MPSKYYFLTDFVSRDQFVQLRIDFQKHREFAGKSLDTWGPGELEKFALEKEMISQEEYKKIVNSILM